MTMTEGLTDFLFAAFHQQTEWTEKNGTAMQVVERYRGQLMATYGDRTLDVDLTDLDMDGLHVEDQDNLMDVLDVYDELIKGKAGKKQDVTLILDGAPEGDYKGKFVMNETTWTKLVERLGKDRPLC